MLGVIGGSGFYSLFEGERKLVTTRYGAAEVVFGKFGKKDAAFIARHGSAHMVPPHRVNHRAHFSAFKEIGVKDVIATSASGIISGYKPGDVVLARDFIAPSLCMTFFDSFEKGITHVDMSEPFSAKLCDVLKKAAKKTKLALKDGGIVAFSFGPRFETKAEIGAFGKMGANLVSMTCAPEAMLAREAGMEYANVAMGCNYACGIGGKVDYADVLVMMKKKVGDVKKLFEASALLL